MFLVAALRKGGNECVGLELDRPEIRDHLPPDRVDFVQLYAGSVPLPYDENAFASVVMSEVLEHLDEPESVHGGDCPHLPGHIAGHRSRSQRRSSQPQKTKSSHGIYYRATM